MQEQEQEHWQSELMLHGYVIRGEWEGLIMETNNVFMYLSVIEGLLIVCMLGWEIFWLRKMYQVLWRMPTSEQIGRMVDMIQNDRESIKNSLGGVVGTFESLAKSFGGLNGIGSLFGLGSAKVVNKE